MMIAPRSTRAIRLLAFLVPAAVLVAACQKSPKGDRPEPPNGAPTVVRVGWQIPLATQGQIVQVLKRTDLLERHGLQARFVPFSYGGPQTEAALSGALDVIFVGDQPAINLIARGGQWKIVSRLFFTKTAIMVPPGSPVRTMADLRGKTVASPFGSVAHREATLKEQAAGLNPDRDVRNINLDILEISNVVQAGGDRSWGNIDAVAVWEPSTSLFESRHLARIVDYTRTLGVVAMSDEFITQHQNAAVEFLAAVLQAWAYFAARTDHVNAWYIEDARLSYTPDVLGMAARVEPNYAARSLTDVDLRLSDENLATLENGAAWAFERGFARTRAAMRPAVTDAVLSQALRIARSSSFDPNTLRERQ